MPIQIDEIVRSKRKSIALLITSDGRLVVKSPLKTPQKTIDELVANKSRWIEAKLIVVQNRNLLHQPKEYIEGEDFLFLGEKYQLVLCDGIKEICIRDDKILIPTKFENNINQKLKAWYKQQAKQIFSERIGYYSKRTNINYKAMKITDAQKRWGSCGTNLIINFAWRSVMAPLDVVDYLVVHELCHIIHPNHSKAYWGKVQSIMPDYKEQEKWLKTNQSILSAV